MTSICHAHILPGAQVNENKERMGPAGSWQNKHPAEQYVGMHSVLIGPVGHERQDGRRACMYKKSYAPQVIMTQSRFSVSTSACQGSEAPDGALQTCRRGSFEWLLGPGFICVMSSTPQLRVQTDHAVQSQCSARGQVFVKGQMRL